MEKEMILNLLTSMRVDVHNTLMYNLGERNTTLEQFLKMYGESNSGVILYLIGQLRILDAILNITGVEEE
jgi:hypothetical protein